MTIPTSVAADVDRLAIASTSCIRRQQRVDDLLPGLIDRVTALLDSAAGTRALPTLVEWSIRKRDADAPLRVELKIVLGVDPVSTIFAECRLDEDRHEAVERLAPRFADAVLRLHEAAPELRRAERLARRRARKAEGAGLPCRLLSIERAPTTVDWYMGFFLFLDVEGLDEALRPIIMRWAHYNCWGVRYSFDGLERDQVFRMRARDWLARRGATGAIDSVVLAFLRRSGIGDAELLREIHRAETRFRLTAPDEACVDLAWWHGILRGRVTIEPGLVWEAGTLSIAEAPRRFTKNDVGRRLVDVVRHPFFAGDIKILSASGARGGTATLRCSQHVELFQSAEERFIEGPANEPGL